MADLNAVFPQRRTGPGLFTAFQEGRDKRTQRRMAQQQLEQSKQVTQQGENKLTSQSRDQMMTAYGDLAKELQSIPDNMVSKHLATRRQQFEEKGIDLAGIDQLSEMVQKGDFKTARNYIDVVAKQSGGTKVQGRTPTMLKVKDPETGEVKNVPGVIITDDLGNVTTELAPAPEGAEFDVETRETQDLRRQQIRAEDEELAWINHQRQLVFDNQQQVQQVLLEKVNAGMGTDMATAVSGLGAATIGKRQANQLIELMKGIESGGVERIVDTFQNVFGYRPASEQKAVSLMKRQALAVLEMFTGPKSDSEREFSISMGANFKADAAGNIAVTEILIEEFDRRIAAGNAAMQGKDSYTTYLRDIVNEAGLKVSDNEVLKEVGEDDLAAYMAERGVSRSEAIDDFREGMATKKAGF